MQSNIYVSLSSQLALQKRLDTLANNIANAGTSGFRGEHVSFATELSRVPAEPVSFVTRGATYFSRRDGELVPTGNPLDVAVRGDAWLAIETAGGIAYTRDGRLQMSPDGALQTVVGQPVLDASGAPIQLDPASGPPAIAGDGAITQNGRALGAIGLFQLDPAARLERTENGVVSDLPAIPQLDFNAVGVVAGHVERANVNPVQELTRLVAVQRAFEAVSNGVHDVESALQDALRTLAGA